MTERILRLPAVEAKAGLKKSAIFEKIKSGEFPRPIHLTSRARGWLETDIDQWIQTRVEASRGQR